MARDTKIVRTGVRLLGVAALVAAFHAPAAFAQDAGAALKEGIDLLERGRLEEANKKFREVLAADPSSEEAYALIHGTSGRQILEMLKAKGDAQQVAQRLLNLALKAEVERAKDEAAISALVLTCVTSRDLEAQETARRQLAVAHGEHAVPALLPHLGSNDIDTRASAIMALMRIGSDAVLPLAASLGSGNEMQQRNTANILGGLGDKRAVPALLRASKAGGVLGQSATEASAKLGGKGDAVAAYLDLAAMYLTNDPQVIRNYDKSSTVWSMKDGKLTGTEVLRGIYHYELAEQAAFDALTAAPGNADAQAMVALAAYGEMAALENISEESRKTEAAQAAIKSLDGVPALAAAVGAEGLVRAFATAAKIRHEDAAMKIADALPAVWGGRGVGSDSPLVAALGNEDRGIRYAAAIALLRVNPPQNFPSASAVATIAGQAAAERATKQVVVVDSDSKNAMNVQKALNDAGFHAVAFTDASAALSAAKVTGGFDAIVVRNRLADLTTFQVLDEVNRDLRTQNMKKLVMADNAQLGEAEADFAKRNIAGVVPTSADAQGVVNKVKETLASPEGDVGRVRANAVSKAACSALQGANGAVFPLKDAEPGLLDAAGEGADEEVRVAALAALGNCATPNAQNALRAILAKAENSAALRAGAAGALGKSLRGQEPAPETFDALLGAMGDADGGVRHAAGAAMGQMKLTPEQQGRVLASRRT
jgi:HEAT repeat protein